MAFAPVFQRPFSATFSRAAAAAGNGLLNALIAYWPGNEASGNLLDAHTNALHLTDVNTVTNAAGKVYATARQYTAANREYHARPGDDALLSTGDVDFTLAAWVYFDTLPAVGEDPTIISKDIGTSAGQREYRLDAYNSAGTHEVRWITFVAGGGIAGKVIANPAPTTAAWSLYICSHDSVADQVAISVNGGAPVTAASSAPGDSTAAFEIGRRSERIVNYHNGRIGPTAFWKSAAGGGGVLTAAQRTALYNGGAGLPYASFTA